MKTISVPDPGSYRDSFGRVFHTGQRIIRGITPQGCASYNQLRQTCLIQAFANEGRLVRSWEPADGGQLLDPSLYPVVLEHERLNFISYPYEWSFAALKDAALFHLDLHMDLLKVGFTLRDATAFNVQFIKTKPIFMDLLSITPYRDGEKWVGHRQFLEQFLNPLLLTIGTGMPFQKFYRASPDGIPNESVIRMLPLAQLLRPAVVFSVVLPAWLEKSAKARSGGISPRPGRPLPKEGLEGLLRHYRRWISRIRCPSEKTVWRDYAQTNSYSTPELADKHAFVAEFASRTRPALLWDLGCNIGEFSITALENGADRVIGFDADVTCIDIAYERAKKKSLDFLPLYQDFTNPSPSQGWRQSERLGFAERASAQGLLALALVHHLAIAHNVPLEAVVGWLMGLAPQGIIEFVQKDDPMVERLLSTREDIFGDYHEANFLAAIRKYGRIISTKKLAPSGRLLCWYQSTG